MQGERFVAFLILFLMIFMQIGTDLYLPSFPAISEQLATTNAMVQHTFSVFLAGFAVSQLIYGTLADRYGRKPFLVFGITLYLLMCVICATADSIKVLLIARGIQGLGAGACTAMSRTIMRDVFSGKAFEKMVLYQTLVWSFIPITAPLLGSYIQHYLGWRYNFVFLALLGFIGLMLAMIFKETIKKREKTLHFLTVLGDYKTILCDKRFFPPLICTMGVISMIATFNVTAPLLLQETLRLSPIQYGWSVFGVGLSFLIGTLLNRYFMTRLQGEQIVNAGMACIVLCVVLLLSFNLFSVLRVEMVIIPIMIMQFGLALVFPNKVARATTLFPEKAGKVAALFGCMLFLGGSAASAIMAELPEDSLFPLSMMLLGLLLLMSIFHFTPAKIPSKNE